MIPVNEPLLNGNEKKYLIECIDTGWISSEGPFVKKLEEKMAEVCGRKYAIAVSNGTVALEAAIQALRLPIGSEVILPSFTIISCASSILKNGLKPVVIDSEPVTWNMDVTQIEKAITSKTSAILVVHIYGLPSDMNPILALAKKYNLKIIEDAAEQIGQTCFGKVCGSFGDISTLSFYPNKHVTTGEGGMILTDNLELAERSRSIRNLCFKPEKRFVHEEMSSNYRMTNLQAAVGVAQVERLNEFLEIKRFIGKEYQTLLAGHPHLELPPVKTEYSENIYWVYGLVLKESVKGSAEQICRDLTKEKIGTRPFFYPMHLQPVFKKMGLFNHLKLPVAERISERGFYLPSGLALTTVQIRQSAESLCKVLETWT